MIAWHGTHVLFREFSTLHIGSGEGGEGLGWGLYFSENREGGEYFARYAAKSKGAGYLYRVWLDVRDDELIYLGTEDSPAEKRFLWSQYERRRGEYGDEVFAKVLRSANNQAVVAYEETKPSHGLTILCLSADRIQIQDVFKFSQDPYDWIEVTCET